TANSSTTRRPPGASASASWRRAWSRSATLRRPKATVAAAKRLAGNGRARASAASGQGRRAALAAALAPGTPAAPAAPWSLAARHLREHVADGAARLVEPASGLGTLAAAAAVVGRRFGLRRGQGEGRLGHVRSLAGKPRSGSAADRQRAAVPGATPGSPGGS